MTTISISARGRLCFLSFSEKVRDPFPRAEWRVINLQRRWLCVCSTIFPHFPLTGAHVLRERKKNKSPRSFFFELEGLHTFTSLLDSTANAIWWFNFIWNEAAKNTRQHFLPLFCLWWLHGEQNNTESGKKSTAKSQQSQQPFGSDRNLLSQTHFSVASVSAQAQRMPE